jgi:hypothetical protein
MVILASADELIPSVMFRIMETEFETLLDCACGRGKWGYLSKIWLDQLRRKSYLVGCDAWLPHLEFCKRHQIYDDEVRCDIRALPFRDSSVDIAVACEVIEHLPKAQGASSIHEMERITNLRLIVSTPNGPWPQAPSPEGDLEEHRSCWSARDLQRLGFRVAGVGPAPLVRSRPVRFLADRRLTSVLAWLLVVATGMISPIFPSLGTLLVAWKDRRTS